jgi:hypothetical protein
MLWKRETLSEKAFCFYFVHEIIGIGINISISTFDKMRRSLRLEAKRKIIECEKNVSINIRLKNII